MSRSQSKFGLGKTGDSVANWRNIIENITTKIENNEKCLDPNLKSIQMRFLEALLIKAKDDYRMALANHNN